MQVGSKLIPKTNRWIGSLNITAAFLSTSILKIATVNQTNTWCLILNPTITEDKGARLH